MQTKRCSSRRRRGRRVRRCASNKYLYLRILLLLVSNDIHRNPGPPLGKNTLNISSFNARSIVNKRLELQSHVAPINPDIIAITETWLHEGIADNEIFPFSYNVLRNDRGSIGGGVLLAFWYMSQIKKIIAALSWQQPFPPPSNAPSSCLVINNAVVIIKI